MPTRVKILNYERPNGAVVTESEFSTGRVVDRRATMVSAKCNNTTQEALRERQEKDVNVDDVSVIKYPITWKIDFRSLPD